MFKYYFKNLETGEIFTKVFNSPYFRDKFLANCRYSKKIRSLGGVQLYG